MLPLSTRVSAALNAQVESLELEHQKSMSDIQGIKPPDPSQKAEYEAALQRLGQLRGRPLFYPFLASGRGRGPFVELLDGSVKIDLINGIGINLMGHAHPGLTQASLRGAMSDVIMQGNIMPGVEYFQATEKLISVAQKGSRMEHAWLATCGSMANENALKICRQKRGGARKIIAFENAFAGRSTMMAEITDNEEFKVGLPRYNEVLRLPFSTSYGGDCQKECVTGCKVSSVTSKVKGLLEGYIQEHGNDIACFMFEPVQGEGGFTVGCPKFLVPLFEVCKKAGIPVWADEVQTFYRTGEFFAYQTLGIGEHVDICTIAKTFQGAATIYTSEMNPKPGLIAGTFSGSSAALSAGVKTLEILEKGYLGEGGRIQAIHRRFVSGLKKLSESTCKGRISEVGGLGLMVAFTPLDGSKDKTIQILKHLFQNGLIAYYCGHGPYRLRFLVPAIISDSEIDLALSLLEKSLVEIG